MKKIINLLLSACVLLSLTGCNKSEEHVEPVIDTGIYTLNDFESNAEFNLIRLNGVLGRVEKNVDEAYVKTGLASAKVTVEANPYKPGAPYIQQAFELKKAGKDFRNFSSVSMLSVDVYNATGGKARIGMQLNYEFSNGTRKNFELEEGWNTVRFNVKREYIPQSTNTDNVTAPFVEGLSIMFERGAEDSVYYVDNIRLYSTEKSYTPITMSLKENEICSLDKEWQIELLESEGRSELLASYMQVSDITATGSGCSMRVEAPSSTSNLGSWPGFFLNRDMTALVPWSEYPSDAILSFDLYAPEENGMDTIWLSMYSGGTRYFVTDGLQLTPGKWITYSFSVKDMNMQMSSSRHNVGTTTGLVIRWEEKAGPTKIFYIDNFRMEFSDK
jgi:hypothetical protein